MTALLASWRTVALHILQNSGAYTPSQIATAWAFLRNGVRHAD